MLHHPEEKLEGWIKLVHAASDVTPPNIKLAVESQKWNHGDLEEAAALLEHFGSLDQLARASVQ